MLQVLIVLGPAHGPCLLCSSVISANIRVNCFADGQLTDLASFYTLPSSVIGHDRHTEMRAAFHYYTVSWRQQDARCMAVPTVWRMDPTLWDGMFGFSGLDGVKVSSGESHLVWQLLHILCAGEELSPQTVLHKQVPGRTPLLQLLSDALILAKRSGHDVYNALDLMQNMEVFKVSSYTAWEPSS